METPTTVSNSKDCAASVKYPIGTRFVKDFPGYGSFEGIVLRYDGYCYSVRYPHDGDEEDLDEEELDGLVGKEAVPTTTPPRSDDDKHDEDGGGGGDDDSTTNQKDPTLSEECPSSTSQTREHSIPVTPSPVHGRRRRLSSAKYPNGTRFVKDFPDYGTFEGVVLKYDGDYYTVWYPEDGDREDLDEEELDSLVGNKMKKRKWSIMATTTSPKRSQQRPSRPVGSILPTITQCFAPLCPDNFDDLRGTTIHTLILGTHPSKVSLRKKMESSTGREEYFSSTANFFWWIAGDSLGFRRGTGLRRPSVDGRGTGDDTDLYYKHCTDLRYDESHVIPYDEQERVFCRHGFGLWDIVRSCTSIDSRDSNIRNEVPNDVRGFVSKYPSIQRIVIANGKSGLRLFNKHFQDWWESGELIPDEEETETAAGLTQSVLGGQGRRSIRCISAISLSPLVTTQSYKEKRDFWDSKVYQPGLQLHREAIAAVEEQKLSCTGSD